MPDHLLYTLIQPTATECTVMETDATDEHMEIERPKEADIDLMDTDSETDNDFESEQDSDREFVNDSEMSDEGELSFYRRFDRNLSFY